MTKSSKCVNVSKQCMCKHIILRKLDKIRHLSTGQLAVMIWREHTQGIYTDMYFQSLHVSEPKYISTERLLTDQMAN